MTAQVASPFFFHSVIYKTVWANKTPFLEFPRDIKHSGIASQFLTEVVKRLQRLFGFLDKPPIAVEMVEEDGIVDMLDGDTCFLKLLSHQNVFIAIAAEASVERVG